jgi:hypothetical protein
MPVRRISSLILAAVTMCGGALLLYIWGAYGGNSIVVFLGSFAFLGGIVWTGVETIDFLIVARQ